MNVTLGEVVFVFHFGGDDGFRGVGRELMEKMIRGALGALDRAELESLGIQRVETKVFGFTPLDTKEAMQARIDQVRMSDSRQDEEKPEAAG